MKMKKEHYEQIKTAMEKVMAREPDSKEKYKKANLSKTRYAWDAFHITCFSSNVLYEYLNDDHITTALLKIVGEY